MKRFLLAFLFLVSSANADWIIDTSKPDVLVTGSTDTIARGFSPLDPDPVLALSNDKLLGNITDIPVMKVRRVTAGDEVDIYDFIDGTEQYQIAGGKILDRGTETFYVVNWYDQSGGFGSELVTNGDMELDSNWFNIGTPTVNERSSTQVHTGTYSRKFTVNAANEGIFSTSFTTTLNKIYKASAWVYPSIAQGKIFIRYGGGSGTGILKYFTGMTPNTWNYIEVYYTEIEGGSGSIIRFDSNTDTSGTWYIDDVSIKELTGNHATQTTAANQPELTWVEMDSGSLGSELLSNNDFEVFTGGFANSWVKYSVTQTYTQETTIVQNGSSSQKITCIDDSGAIGAYQSVSVTAGKLYKLSGWVRQNSSRVVTLWAGAPGFSGTGINFSIPANTWTYVEKYEIATATGLGSLWFYNSSANSGLTDVLYLDNASIKEITAFRPTLKFDGSNDYLSLGSFTPINTGNPHTIFTKVSLTGYPNLYPHMWHLQSNIASLRAMINQQINYQDIAVGGSSGWSNHRANIGGFNLSTFQTLAFLYNGNGATNINNFNIYLDAINQTLSSASPFGVNNSSQIGAYNGTFVWQGYIENFLFYNKELSTHDITRLNNYYD